MTSVSAGNRPYSSRLRHPPGSPDMNEHTPSTVPDQHFLGTDRAIRHHSEEKTQILSTLNSTIRNIYVRIHTQEKKTAERMNKEIMTERTSHRRGNTHKRQASSLFLNPPFAFPPSVLSLSSNFPIRSPTPYPKIRQQPAAIDTSKETGKDTKGGRVKGTHLILQLPNELLVTW